MYKKKMHISQLKVGDKLTHVGNDAVYVLMSGDKYGAWYMVNTELNHVCFVDNGLYQVEKVIEPVTFSSLADFEKFEFNKMTYIKVPDFAYDSMSRNSYNLQRGNYCYIISDTLVIKFEDK